jgi:RNA polymerase sigma factor (sigma-70 family)
MDGAGGAFVATRWTLVLRARGQSLEAQLALGTLCEAYYAPVHAFIRAWVREPDLARDLTQEFFARALRGGALDGVSPERGRFRSFLLGAVRHFLADMHDQRMAQKRGSGRPLVLLEPATDTSPGFDAPDPRGEEMALQFDRRWAFTLLDRALGRLGAELAATGRSEHFEVLKPWLTGSGNETQAEAGARLGLNESAVKVAVHRLRARFRELVRAEIAQTVNEPSEIAAELNHLIEVVART